jgi:glycosyltransferase involved in cell wall biosynthesis
MFSIVIPVHNRASTIQRPLDSLFRQTIQGWECIIVDDGSQDGLESVIKTFDDERLVYIHQDNSGPADARQNGRERAHNEIILYLDSDDAFYPEALETIRDTLEETGRGYGIAAHDRTIRLVDGKGQVVKEVQDDSGRAPNLTAADIYDWKVKTTSSGLFHRNDPRYDEARWRSGVWIEDWEFLLQLIALAPGDFVYVPEVCVDYIQTYGHDGLCSKATYGDYAHAFGQIYEWHKDDPLMRDPSVFLNRVEKYKKLQMQAEAGEIAPQMFKYFPDAWKKS